MKSNRGTEEEGWSWGDRAKKGFGVESSESDTSKKKNPKCLFYFDSFRFSFRFYYFKKIVIFTTFETNKQSSKKNKYEGGIMRAETPIFSLPFYNTLV